ncbi:Protein of uncharacterised function (DUF2637) [Mycobacteroides abscessus subsp. abscessus]|uniref:DUF2637 domain-containing protein n=1 Tax=Mycobacteroides abscessus TaxID=36809 RepID=UPI0009CF4F7D|nr:DUF2637 domain-containing protein [Mycobacteroides abscessus]SLJ22838.1 Protein of uncharacterised function (DUF2637) [Mycobacteroides abscessus subsp. abscessus]
MKFDPAKILALIGIGHDAPPARAWTLLLVTFVGISVYGNTAHALLTGHGWTAAAWFAVAPVALFWVTHLVAKTAGKSPSGAVKWLVWLVGIPAALTVSGMAFVVSFRALRAWTMHQGGDELSSILLPLIVDIIIALSSTMVLAMRPAKTATASVIHEPAVHPVAAPEPDPVTPVIQQPTARRDSHELPAVPPLMPSTHAPVIQRPEPATDPVNQPTPETVQETVIHAASWDDADTEPVMIQSAPAVNHVPEPAVNQTAEPEPAVIQEPVTQAEPQPANQTEAPVNHPAATEAVQVDEPAVNQAEADEVDHRAKAEAVAARRDWPVETLERISRNTPGPSNRDLAKDLALSAASVQRMRKALEAAEETAPVA